MGVGPSPKGTSPRTLHQSPGVEIQQPSCSGGNVQGKGRLGLSLGVSFVQGSEGLWGWKGHFFEVESGHP